MNSSGSFVKHVIERLFLLFLACLFVFISVPSNSMDTLGLRKVVIDPGHGGKDPGCLGKFSHEADVALAISLKLGKYIKDYYNEEVEVIFTRTKDEFVDLAERARMANQVKADLFICIHANASENKSSKGTETYALGLHKTDAQFKVAERENSVILIEDNHSTKYQDFNPKDPDNYIFISMVTKVFLDQSIRFAELIQSNVSTVPNLTNRGVRQAGFLVLHQVNMPSVLVETGFLTNAEEEKILNNEKDQVNIARAIFRAFCDYKTEVDLASGLPAKKRKDPDIVIPGYSKDVRTEERVEEKKDVIVEKKEEAPVISTSKVDETKVIFKVQIATSVKPLDKAPDNFNGLSGVEEYMADGIYKYTYGKSNNFEEAVRLQTEAREKGFKTAFVVAFLNGERITDLKKARDMANK
jgi:N-acetylmuramoyl-L-alanine amidase